MTALAFVVVCVVGLTAGRGLAGWGGDVLRLRLGGDAQATRVVVDLDGPVEGAVLESGANGRVVLNLRGARARSALEGEGRGLVRRWRVSSQGTSSRLDLTLNGGARIERRFLLPPGDGVEHHRYVVDLVADGRPSAAPAPERRAAPRRDKPLIVIDAGHGGRDPGALGHDERESTLALAAALALKSELERTGRYRVVMTRDRDVYVPLPRRVEMARAAGADLFISLHLDSSPDPATRGASVYTLSEQGAGRAIREFTGRDDWTRQLDLPGHDPGVDRILLDITQRSTQNQSARFARGLLGEIEGAGHPLLRRSHRDAGLAVLLAPDVPAVLLEMGFITNPDDARALSSDAGRRRVVRAVVRGIDAFFLETSPTRMAQASDGRGAP
jgi:N-acetylmuramoyl-L-alanine amidase